MLSDGQKAGRNAGPKLGRYGGAVDVVESGCWDPVLGRGNSMLVDVVAATLGETNGICPEGRVGKPDM